MDWNAQFVLAKSVKVKRRDFCLNAIMGFMSIALICGFNLIPLALYAETPFQIRNPQIPGPSQ